MGYTDVFGGELIFPSRISYLEITTAVDIVLQWPTEQQITGDEVVADVMDITTSAPSLNIDMPDARNTATGNKTTVNNVGGQTFTVRDVTGGTIQSVASGEQWVIVLTDNTTDMGVWTTFQLGAQVAVASASALAGDGIKAISVLLNQKIDSDVEAATPFSAVDGDRAKCLIYTGGAGTCNLPSPGTVGNDWFFMLRNAGSGTLNIVPPSGTIDGATDINLSPDGSTFIFTDGTDFFTIGLTVASSIAFDFVSLPVPGSGDFILSGANLNRIAYRFTGALTGARNIVVPNTTQQYWCDRQTTGSFAFTVATSGQASPPSLDEGEAIILYCDGTDVVNAVSSTAIVLPLSVLQGGTGATTASGAQANLSVPPITRDMIAGVGLTGGGTLAADRTFDVDGSSNFTVDHTTVSLLAGTGVSGTGLGDISASRTINLDATSPLNDDHSAVVLSAGIGISASGLGDITASRTINAEISDTTQLGVVERATQAEVDAGSDISRYLTPNTFDLSQQLLDVASQVVVTTGTFFPGFVGFSVDPTVELRWTKWSPTTAFAYSQAVLNGISGSGFGTSNANTYRWTGIASEVAPSSIATGSTNDLVAQDNTTFNHASIGILNTVPDMSFLKLVGVQYDLAGWTSSGTKGQSNNSFLFYVFQP